MALLSNLNSSKPFENILFANDNRLICQKHLQDLDSFYFRQGLLYGLKSNFAACPKCEVPEDRNGSCLATFQGYPANQCCVISPDLCKIASEPTPIEKNPSLNLQHYVAEHVLWDMNSDGFGLNGLVYIKDQKVLAACSKNGSVCFWSIGDSIELIEPKLNLEKKINFAKYCMKYLIIGTDKGVHVYHMAEDISSLRLIGVIDEEKMVSDLDFLGNEGKILTGYDESTAKVWSLETLEMEKVVDLHQFNIKGKIHTIMYLNRTGELAIEHANGLSVIKDWQHKDGHVRYHLVARKDSFGCKHLPNIRRFVMSIGKSDVQVLQEEDLAEVKRHSVHTLARFSNEKSLRRFLVSQDESVIISNGPVTQLNSFQGDTAKNFYLSSFIWGMSDIELIEDQYRIALAHPQKGTVMIFRINANMNIERNEGLSPLPAVKKAEDRLVPSSTQNGGLFSGGGNLFSGGGGSLFSGSGASGGLFSRNSASYLRNPPTRVNNSKLFSSIKSNKKAPAAKPKPTAKPAKKGKKIQKVQLRSNASKKKEKVAVSSVKKEKKKTTKAESLKKQKKTEQKKGIIEAVRIKGKKKTKEEKVWVVLPSDEDDNEKKKVRGRSLKKTTKTKESKSIQSKKGKRRSDSSQDKGSRSRSKSKSVIRKK